jgi:hypothetical protein
MLAMRSGANTKDNQPKRTMKTDTRRTDDEKDQMHWTHWLYIVPLSFALSPIGTFIGVIAWELDFVDTCLLIAIQFLGFLKLFIISNGGE